MLALEDRFCEKAPRCDSNPQPAVIGGSAMNLLALMLHRSAAENGERKMENGVKPELKTGPENGPWNVDTWNNQACMGHGPWQT